MSESEFSNMFGVITEDRVTYFFKKSWFSGGSRQDVPLKHVTSVRYEVQRNVAGGIVLSLIGLAMLFSGETGIAVFGVLIVVLGGLLLWGSPAVAINTAGNDLNVMKSWPWKRNEAQEFTDTLRKKLFKE